MVNMASKNRAKPKARKTVPKEKKAKKMTRAERQQKLIDSGVANWFTDNFPALFTSFVPMQIGTGKEIRAMVQSMDEKPFPVIKVRQFLRLWTDNPAYQQAIINKTYRTCLDGSRGDKITDQDKQAAREVMKRFK
ncbi:hypothetical protein HW45_03550 [Vibrio sp. ER1A]|nr:hypothetical protein HW45_03550 [Vibrio sp. ER1A]